MKHYTETVGRDAQIQEYHTALQGQVPNDQHECRTCRPVKRTSSGHAVAHEPGKIKIVALKRQSTTFRSNVQTRHAQKRNESAEATDPDVICRNGALVSDDCAVIACLFEKVPATSEGFSVKDHAEWQVSDTSSTIQLILAGGRGAIRRPVSGQTTVGEFLKEICTLYGAAGVRSVYHLASSASLFFLERIGNIVSFSDVWAADLIEGKGSDSIQIRENIPLFSPAPTSVHRKVARNESSLSSKVSQSTYNVIKSCESGNSAPSQSGTSSHIGSGGGFWLESGAPQCRSDGSESTCSIEDTFQRPLVPDKFVNMTQALTFTHHEPLLDEVVDDEEDESESERDDHQIQYAAVPLFDSDDCNESDSSSDNEDNASQSTEVAD